MLLATSHKAHKVPVVDAAPGLSSSCILQERRGTVQCICAKLEKHAEAALSSDLAVDVVVDVGQEAHEVPLLAIELVLDLSVLVLLVLGELSLDCRVLVLALAEDVLLDLSILVELSLQECCSHAQLQADNTASVSRAPDRQPR